MTAMETYITPKPGEAAAGVERHDVEAVNRKADRQSYADRKKIYAKLTHGTFRNLKWIVMAVCLGIYYLLPFLRWDRGPGLPDQAVLFDVANGRIFFFWLAIWPQELYLVTGFLVLSALILFLATAISGRVWCGYLCWQTVWTDLMIAVERFFQGDRNARIRLDKEPWSASKIYKKVMTHFTWVIIAVLTGGAFTFYFRDAPTLLVEFVTGEAPMIAYLFLGLFTFMTYLMGGIAREQVCIYMCPYARFQSVMFDHDTLIVSYDPRRGEPRGSRKRGADPQELGLGDCIDCELCVQVCPTGIDIRDGLQYQCIGCALCIDACNSVMDKMEYPRGLIRYTSEDALAGGTTRWLRPRIIGYTLVLAVMLSVFWYTMASRVPLELTAIRDRNQLFVTTDSGAVENIYTLQLANMDESMHEFEIDISGLEGATLIGETTHTLNGGEVRSISIRVRVPQGTTDSPGSTLYFNARATDAPDLAARAESRFMRPL